MVYINNFQIIPHLTRYQIQFGKTSNLNFNFFFFLLFVQWVSKDFWFRQASSSQTPIKQVFCYDIGRSNVAIRKF